MTAPVHIPEPWAPGSWVQARLSRFDTSLLTLLLAGIALNRAWDYATPPPWVPAYSRPSPGLLVVESAAPLWLWIGWLVGAALLLGVSAVARIHRGVFLGHAALFLAYLGLSVGLLVEYLAQPWADGVRSAGPLVVVTCLHLLITIRTGWRPIEWTPTRSRIRQ